MIIERFKLTYNIDQNKSVIRLFGEKFYNKNKFYGYYIYENKVEVKKNFLKQKI